VADFAAGPILDRDFSAAHALHDGTHTIPRLDFFLLLSDSKT
jgi:hypothetical protein